MSYEIASYFSGGESRDNLKLTAAFAGYFPYRLRNYSLLLACPLNSNLYLIDSLSSTQVKQTQLLLTNPFFIDDDVLRLTGISSSDNVTEKRVGVT